MIQHKRQQKNTVIDKAEFNGCSVKLCFSEMVRKSDGSSGMGAATECREEAIKCNERKKIDENNRNLLFGRIILQKSIDNSCRK